MRKHVLVQMDQWPSAQEIRHWESYGVILVTAMPDRGVVVSTPYHVDTPGYQQAVLPPEGKISPLIPRPAVAGTRLSFVVEFGAAAGKRIWVVSELPIEPGMNVITVTARDGGGMPSSGSVTVHYRQPIGPPEIEITWPVVDGVHQTDESSVCREW